MTHLDLGLQHARLQRVSPIARLSQMISVSRQRSALRQLDETMLRDLGITPEAARIEANRSFWDLPTPSC